jgi:hypothetical protein
MESPSGDMFRRGAAVAPVSSNVKLLEVNGKDFWLHWAKTGGNIFGMFLHVCPPNSRVDPGAHIPRH